MSIRSLDLRDLPTISRYRNEAVALDTARVLTRGNPLGAVGFLSYFNPSRHVYAAVADGNEASLLGGIIHTRGEMFAKLHYLAPSSRLDHPDLPALAENLSAQAGTWGAFHVLAEVDEDSDAFRALRLAGFAVYAWQRMWDVSHITESAVQFDWMRVKSIHLPAAQSLYHQIVPPLVQPVESMPKKPGGWICNEAMKCYVSMMRGVYGIVLAPLIHPEATGVSEKFSSLINHLPERGNRPVYVCVRSYQAWLEPVLEDLGAQAASRQAVMVKHLAHMIKEEQTVKVGQPAGVTVQPSRIHRMGSKNK